MLDVVLSKRTKKLAVVLVLAHNKSNLIKKNQWQGKRKKNVVIYRLLEDRTQGENLNIDCIKTGFKSLSYDPVKIVMFKVLESVNIQNSCPSLAR